jgi:hypothetical protein
VTNFWEHLFTGKDAHASGKIEEQQAWNIADAASKTPGLEHYVYSTLPSPTKISGGKHEVPHMDYKEQVDNRIRNDLPELAKKTTFFWLGWYPSNIAFYPMAKAIKVVSRPHSTSESKLTTSSSKQILTSSWLLPPLQLTFL